MLHLLMLESDQLHEDVRSGKDTGPRDDNAPSNGLLLLAQTTACVTACHFSFQS